MNSVNIFDCFSGVGGFRLGATAAFKEFGLQSKSIGRCEIDENADKVYRSFYRTSGEKNYCDINAMIDKKIWKSQNELNEVDFFFAGFPCQPFSSMGLQQGLNDPRGNLFFSLHKLISSIRPKIILLENVRGINFGKNKTILQLIAHELEKIKYHVNIWLLNAADYGVPQIRRRYFIYGENKSHFNKHEIVDPPKCVPSSERKYPTTWHLLEKDVKLKYPNKNYYLSDKLKKTILSNGTGGYNYKWSIDNLVAKPLCRTMHKMHRASQDNYFSDAYIRGKYLNESDTVLHDKCGASQIRRLTPLEAFRLQGLPDEQVEEAKRNSVSDTQLYMQAGNAVPATVVKEIIKHILTRRFRL